MQHKVLILKIYANGQQTEHYSSINGMAPDSLLKRFLPYIVDRVKDNIRLKANPYRIDRDSLVVMAAVMRFN